MAIVPIRPAIGVAALLVVLSRRRRPFNTDEIELLELLAAHAAARLETLASIDALRRRAAEDPLTGIGNRSAFSDRLEQWENDGTSGALVLIDVDRFKSINDTFGHLEGDHVLVELAASLEAALLPDQHVYRLGGDEFAVLLPGHSEIDARFVGDRLDLAAGSVLQPRSAGLSIGVAVVDPDLEVELALRIADRDLYESKRRRRLPSASA